MSDDICHRWVEPIKNERVCTILKDAARSQSIPIMEVARIHEYIAKLEAVVEWAKDMGERMDATGDFSRGDLIELGDRLCEAGWGDEEE